MVWLSEIVLVLALPVGILLTLSHSDRSDYLPRLICGIIIILAVCLFHWMAERRQRRERPEIAWLPWHKRIWLTIIPLLIFAPLGIMCGIAYGSPTTDPIIEENSHLILDFLYWVISYTAIIVIRILDACYSHWNPERSRISPGIRSRVVWKTWISEILLVLAVPVCVQKILDYCAMSKYSLALLEDPLRIILAVGMLRWLVELRQQRERPEIVWLPWYKRILLTLIPLLICAPVCVYLGLRYNDPVVSPVSIGSAQFFIRLFFWLCSYMTVILVRVIDNRFSHWEAK